MINKTLDNKNKKANSFTKKCLTEGLILLLTTKKYEDITITELCEKSGVSRTAFYRNYKTINEILKDINQGSIELINESFKEPKYKNNLELWFVDYFKFIKANIKLIRPLLKNQILHFKIINDLNHNSYILTAIEAAITAITIKWMENNLEDDMNELAKICTAIIKNLEKDLKTS